MKHVFLYSVSNKHDEAMHTDHPGKSPNDNKESPSQDTRDAKPPESGEVVPIDQDSSGVPDEGADSHGSPGTNE